MELTVPLIKLGVNNPVAFCYAGGAYAGVKAVEKFYEYQKHDKLPEEINTSSTQNLSAKNNDIVLLRGELRGDNISDELTRGLDGVRRCFQEVEITHSFNVERVERVQHVHRSNVPLLYDRTYTNETRIERFSHTTEPFKRESAMTLKVYISGTNEYINIPIARTTKETSIIGEGHYSYLQHSSSIREASLRCNRHPRQEDSTYSISEKYLEIGKQIIVHGTLKVHSLKGQADRFEIVKPTLISHKTKDKLKSEDVEGGIIWTVVAAFFFGSGCYCCKKKKK